MTLTRHPKALRGSVVAGNPATYVAPFGREFGCKMRLI